MHKIASALILLSVSLAAPAEIEKTGQVCDQGVCQFWWPRLLPIKGWQDAHLCQGRVQSRGT
jgi:hypothetical protein